MTPGYQVPFAETHPRARPASRPAPSASSTTRIMAEAIVAEGKADLVALARAMLADPRWPWRAAVGARRAPAPGRRSTPARRR